MNHALAHKQKNKTSKVINHHNYKQSAEQNNTVKQLLVRHRIQAKLKISQPDDPLEREADEMADRVMGISDEDIHRKSVGNDKDDQIKSKLLGGSDIQRMSAIQTKTKMYGRKPQVEKNIENKFNAIQGGGQPLSKREREFFEPRFGRNFSGVRIYLGRKANDIAEYFNAKALVRGNDIVFRNEYFNPKSNVGLNLIAHELAHITQNNKEKTGIQRKYDYHSQDLGKLNKIQLNELKNKIELSILFNNRVSNYNSKSHYSFKKNQLAEISRLINFDELVTRLLEDFYREFHDIVVRIPYFDNRRKIFRNVVVTPPYYMNFNNIHGDMMRRLSPNILRGLPNFERLTREQKNNYSAGRNQITQNRVIKAIYHRRWNRVHHRPRNRVNLQARQVGNIPGRWVLSGKGASMQIKEILERAYSNPRANSNIHPNRVNLRNWLIKYGIGIDCSGFVSQALNFVVNTFAGRRLDAQAELGQGVRNVHRRSRIRIRRRNSDVLLLRPGDMMRIQGHIRVITNIYKNRRNRYVFTTIESRSGAGPDRADWYYANGQMFIRRRNAWRRVRSRIELNAEFWRYNLLSRYRLSTQIAGINFLNP